ncbi:GAF sensor signal transduction histidine kinase [Sulfitobacter brevis]|uniref:histidine kinase n=1 Tax=Sulfitobacter brevis TaxID=74348 RepID=A0A1I1STP2_9RHOB|nr:GAF domain-containing sensor histidine kinase [Sulfitobacter brevis]SFD49786.1 GAF sensor signal transduction histidine kinase [Sulfitobacter brevis]
MNQSLPVDKSTQGNAEFLLGTHDFQADIEIISGSDFIGTVLETIMLATDMRFAAVARVTADRWVTCRSVDEVNFGLVQGDEIEIESTFCETVRVTGERVMFNNVATDDQFRNHPIAAKFGIVSYASIPIYRGDGSFFGTLCAIDTEPREVKHPRVVAMLEMFANLIGQSLETEEQLAAQEQLVLQERELTKIQEEFVAVLGHDLRNPVAAIGAGLRQLAKEPQSEKSELILPLMRSSLRRVSELVDNIMMHAKSRLGGGIRVNMTEEAPLAEALIQVVDEIRISAPQQEITLSLDINQPVQCDADRLAQAMSNLISNALNHGTPGMPVHVLGTCTVRELTIAVSNSGEMLQEDLERDLFRPFQRGQTTKSEGLGLGLFIASSIARSHNGTIEVSSQNGMITFALKIPRIAQ